MKDDIFSPTPVGNMAHYIEVLLHINRYFTERSTDVYIGPGYFHLLFKDASLYWYITPYELANAYTMQVLDSVMNKKMDELIQTVEKNRIERSEKENYAQSNAIRFTHTHHLVEPMHVFAYQETTACPSTIILADEGKDYPSTVIDVLYMYNSAHGIIPKYGIKPVLTWPHGENNRRNTNISDFARPDDFTTHLLVVDKNTARYLLIRNTQEQRDVMDAFIHQLERARDAR